MLTLDIQRESQEACPDDTRLRRAAEQALTVAARAGEDWELSLRLVDVAEMQQLNRQYRGKDKPTNVLSFPTDFPEDVPLPLLGDVIICAPVVRQEALDQDKAPDAHWDHLLIHGVLHLLGFDHQEIADAERMEALERQALAVLGWPDPYLHPDQPRMSASA